MSLQTEVTRLQGIKGDIQTALVNKGVSGAGSHTMSQFATDIAGISTGTDVSDTTATASDVLSGKAFYLANGTKTSGTIGTGALSTPTVNSSGLVTASVGTTGYMTSGTSSTLQLSTKSSSDLTASGATITAPAGYYPSSASKSISSGALSAISVSSSGLITSSVGTSGYLASGTSKTKQLTTQAAKTVTPSTSSQTAVASGRYTTGAVTVAGDSNLVAGNIKSGVSIFGVSGSLTSGYKRALIQSITYSGRTMYINVSGLPASIGSATMVGSYRCNVISEGSNYYDVYTSLIFSGAPNWRYLQNWMWIESEGDIAVMSFDDVTISAGQIAVTLNQYCTISGSFTADGFTSECAVYYQEA